MFSKVISLVIKAELLQEGTFFLIQLFARDVLVMKKLEIEKTKPTFIISTFKTDIIKVGLVFSISNFFIAKTSLANNWRSFSSSYLALGGSKIAPKMVISRLKILVTYSKA